MTIKDDLALRLESAKTDEQSMNDLIGDYQPFIASTLAEQAGCYVHQQDDLMTIGMLAFKEAVEKYDAERGSFIAYAKQVIKARTIDYQRTQMKFQQETLVMDEEDEQSIRKVEYRASMEKHTDFELAIMRKEEIEALKEEMEHWGLSFEELVTKSPKNEKLRETYKSVAAFIVERRDLLSTVRDSKKLPMAYLEKEFKIQRKKLERGRKYILTMVLISSGDYPLLTEYVRKG